MTQAHSVSAEKRLSGAEQQALTLLKSPSLFRQYLDAMKSVGLVGEERNALAVFIVGVSRLLERPLNLLVKGHSAAGKNFMVNSCLRLFPEDAFRTLTSSSTKSWNYSEDYFQHKIVYLRERNETSGVMHPVRLLISENVLTHQVTVNRGNTKTVQRVVTLGPIASISTTTRDQLEIDDESRNVSLWIDESEKQTQDIIEATAVERTPIPPLELHLWQSVQNLLEKRADIPIMLPAWFPDAAKLVNSRDLRARRYFPAFVTACKTIALIRSFRGEQRISKSIAVRFSDFAIAAIIFQSVFEESQLGHDNRNLETRRAVGNLASSQNSPVEANDLAAALGISKDEAYSRLRAAEEAGAIRRANKSEKNNRKLYFPHSSMGLIPDPDEVFRKVPEIGERVKFTHPLTGKLMTYSRT